MSDKSPLGEMPGQSKYDENIKLRANIESLDDQIGKWNSGKEKYPEDGGHWYEAHLAGKRKQEEQIKANIRERLGIETPIADEKDEIDHELMDRLAHENPGEENLGDIYDAAESHLHEEG